MFLSDVAAALRSWTDASDGEPLFWLSNGVGMLVKLVICHPNTDREEGFSPQVIFSISVRKQKTHVLVSCVIKLF